MNRETEISSDLFSPEVITDDELRTHLAQRGLDPHTAPRACVEEIARTWQLPTTAAYELLQNLLR